MVTGLNRKDLERVGVLLVFWDQERICLDFRDVPGIGHKIVLNTKRMTSGKKKKWKRRKGEKKREI